MQKNADSDARANHRPTDQLVEYIHTQIKRRKKTTTAAVTSFHDQERFKFCIHLLFFSVVFSSLVQNCMNIYRKPVDL